MRIFPNFRGENQKNSRKHQPANICHDTSGNKNGKGKCPKGLPRILRCLQLGFDGLKLMVFGQPRTWKRCFFVFSIRKIYLMSWKTYNKSIFVVPWSSLCFWFLFCVYYKQIVKEKIFQCNDSNPANTDCWMSCGCHGQVLNLIRLFCGWVLIPYISRIHTAYIGEYLEYPAF